MRAGAPVRCSHQHRRTHVDDFGTEEQKAEFLPRILAGEIHFCIGYTEPNAAPTWRRSPPRRCVTATST